MTHSLKQKYIRPKTKNQKKSKSWNKTGSNNKKHFLEITHISGDLTKIRSLNTSKQKIEGKARDEGRMKGEEKKISKHH